MFFFKQFEIFDPVTGDVPGYPFGAMPEIATRARSILSGWTTDRLTKAAKKINNEIQRYFSDLKYVAVEDLRSKLQVGDDEFNTYFEWNGGTPENGKWVFKDDMDEFLEIPTETNCSEVDALKAVIENRDSCLFLPEGAPESEVDHWPEGDTHELFAVLALWLLADAIYWIEKSSDKFGPSIFGEYAIKAMDAVCHAEHVREVEWLEQWHRKGLLEVSSKEQGRREELADSIRRDMAAELAAHEQSKRSARSERLNAARHAKRNHAKDLVCAEWAKNPSKYKSFEKAGADLADWVVDRQLLKNAEPRTVAEWLREYGRGINFKYR